MASLPVPFSLNFLGEMPPISIEMNRLGLRERGWIRGRACLLQVSGQGHLGDCLENPITWDQWAILGMVGALFLTAVICLTKKGNYLKKLLSIPNLQNSN